MTASHRQRVGVFLGATFVLSWLLEWHMLAKGSVHGAELILLMWIPGLVALACSFGFGAQARDLALNGFLPKYWIIAYALPAAVAVLVMIIGAMLGTGEFQFDIGKSLRGAVFLPVLGVLVSLLTQSSSELGWRGFLQTHVRLAKIPAPNVFIGIVWSVWLWPLVMFGDYTNSRTPTLSLITFTLTMSSFSVFLGWLRDRSRSVLPAMLALAVHSTWVHEITPVFFKAGEMDPYFGGEAGFVMATLYIVIAAYLVRREEGFLQV